MNNSAIQFFVGVFPSLSSPPPLPSLFPSLPLSLCLSWESEMFKIFLFQKNLSSLILMSSWTHCWFLSCGKSLIKYFCSFSSSCLQWLTILWWTWVRPFELCWATVFWRSFFLLIFRSFSCRQSQARRLGVKLIELGIRDEGGESIGLISTVNTAIILEKNRRE